MQTTEYAAVPGITECRLDAGTLTDLPLNEAPAPWDCDLTAVVWWGRGGKAALRAAGAGAPAGASALAVVGGMVAYDRTPVGAYREVYGAIGVRSGRSVRGTIPFMSVDSRRSLVGGRGNWSLPKCLAEFTGEPVGGAMTAQGDGWTVRARVRPIGPRFPLRMTGKIVQPWPDGLLREAELRGKARARTAIVTVEVESDGELATWLRPGRHLGAVLTQTRFSLSEARP